MGEKNNGGAPKGNLNAAKHLLRSQKKAAERRDKFARASEKDALGMLKERGLYGTAWGRTWARQYVRLDSAAARLEERLNNAGWFDGKTRQLKGDAWKYMSVIGDLLNHMQRLWDRMVAEKPESGNLEFTASLVDGTPVPTPEEPREPPPAPPSDAPPPSSAPETPPPAPSGGLREKKSKRGLVGRVKGLLASKKKAPEPETERKVLRFPGSGWNPHGDRWEGIDW